MEGDLDILMSLLRDLLILGASPGDEARLIHVDIATGLRPLAARLAGRAGAVLGDLETTMESIQRKGNRQLLVENFLMGLLPEGAAPARDPART